MDAEKSEKRIKKEEGVRTIDILHNRADPVNELRIHDKTETGLQTDEEC